ncbi:MAG: signal peptidase I [Pseudoxanthomonas sp.]
MATLRRGIATLLMVLVVAIPLGVVGMYVANPFGARSYDPRQRVLGYSPYRVTSRSMAPTVQSDQIVIVSAGYYRSHEPRRGDLVVFLHAEDGNVWIKRVIGLPGESIAIKQGVVLVDGRELVEAYVADANAVTDYSRQMASSKVPQDSYLLSGDNRDNSEDARVFGATSRDELTGKVVSILR